MKEYEHQDITNKCNKSYLASKFNVTEDSHKVDGEQLTVDCQIYETVPGLGRYLEVKNLLEKKYGQRLTTLQMDLILTEVLKTMPHEIRMKKKYGDPRYIYGRQNYNKNKIEGKL